LAFLTPFGGAVAPSPSAVPWFPVVGAALGLALGGIWWLAAQLWAAPVAAAVVVAADLALTGMLHLDGLVDSADGLLPPLADPARRLEVMADPATGAFGVGVAVVVLLLRWAALASLRPSAALLGCLWCGSRFLMAAATTRMRYARPGGLAGAFLAARSRSLPLVGLLVGAGLAALGHLPATAALVVLAVGASAVLGLSDRRIGGFTGDVLGAAGMVGETLGLLAAAAHR
jgi:adenosylcobinamide-GDP ribazoletransferase